VASEAMMDVDALLEVTREAAAALFLSPKTIEYHLRHVYQKLGINSRMDLASLFADTG
jgi:DNA-binding CsgD family transcriptional regulator